MNVRTYPAVMLVFLAGGHLHAEKFLPMARAAAEKSDHKSAVELATKAIAKSESDDAYYWRGRSQFCLGKINESLADFDKFVALKPSAKRSLWERGITCYYAKQYKEGAKQFQLYQTFRGNDVENSVWNVLCVARLKGFDAAAKQAIKIEQDRRVPMMQIYDLFRGKGSVKSVLETAQQAKPGARRDHQLFYAHLYVGLYYDAKGDATNTKKHLEEAVKRKIGHYMWDVANVHLNRLKEEPKSIPVQKGDGGPTGSTD